MNKTIANYRNNHRPEKKQRLGEASLLNKDKDVLTSIFECLNYNIKRLLPILHANRTLKNQTEELLTLHLNKKHGIARHISLQDLERLSTRFLPGISSNFTYKNGNPIKIDALTYALLVEQRQQDQPTFCLMTNFLIEPNIIDNINTDIILLNLVRLLIKITPSSQHRSEEYLEYLAAKLVERIDADSNLRELNDSSDIAELTLQLGRIATTSDSRISAARLVERMTDEELFFGESFAHSNMVSMLNKIGRAASSDFELWIIWLAMQSIADFYDSTLFNSEETATTLITMGNNVEDTTNIGCNQELPYTISRILKRNTDIDVDVSSFNTPDLLKLTIKFANYFIGDNTPCDGHEYLMECLTAQVAHTVTNEMMNALNSNDMVQTVMALLDDDIYWSLALLENILTFPNTHQNYCKAIIHLVNNSAIRTANDQEKMEDQEKMKDILEKIEYITDYSIKNDHTKVFTSEETVAELIQLVSKPGLNQDHYNILAKILQNILLNTNESKEFSDTQNFIDCLNKLKQEGTEHVAFIEQML